MRKEKKTLLWVPTGRSEPGFPLVLAKRTRIVQQGSLVQLATCWVLLGFQGNKHQYLCYTLQFTKCFRRYYVIFQVRKIAHKEISLPQDPNSEGLEPRLPPRTFKVQSCGPYQLTAVSAPKEQMTSLGSHQQLNLLGRYFQENIWIPAAIK